MSDENETVGLQCPAPVLRDRIQLDHGSGGQLSQQLLQEVIHPRFANSELLRGHDSALLDLSDPRIAFTTDSYVVKPLVFPGGDIGKLAVYGTVNDLLMAGARPRYISCSLIIEEGLELTMLAKILDSMAAAARETGVNIVTGDTKVVDKGHGDGLYINTAGIGLRSSHTPVAPQSIRVGDRIILSSDIGRHGLAVMAQREGLRFDTPITSDCASLLPAVSALLDGGIDMHCLRDATRGGIASILVELAETCGHAFQVDRRAIPVSDIVAGGCELLGLDPLYVANEGCFVAFVPEDQVEKTLRLLGQHSVSSQCALIGQVSEGEGKVHLTTEVGSRRTLRRMTGQLLPRIC